MKTTDRTLRLTEAKAPLPVTPCHPTQVEVRRLNPLEVYLGRLLESSSLVTMEHALETAARTMSDGAFSRHQVRWEALRYEHVIALRGRLLDSYKPRTVNKILSAVRGVLSEACALGLMTADDMHRIRAVRSVKVHTLPAGRMVPLSELTAIFVACQAAANKSKGLRDQALLSLMFGAGLRREECARLDLDNYNVETGEIAILAGKGRKDRLTYLGAGGRLYLAQWLMARGPRPGPVFCAIDRHGNIAARGMSSQAIYDVAANRAREAGVARFSPHDLRRTFISQMLDSAVDLTTVRDMVGHASVETTARYDRRGEQRKQKSAEVLQFPGSGLSQTCPD